MTDIDKMRTDYRDSWAREIAGLRLVVIDMLGNRARRRARWERREPGAAQVELPRTYDEIAEAISWRRSRAIDLLDLALEDLVAEGTLVSESINYHLVEIP